MASVQPLPLTVKDITNVVEAHPMYIDRGTLDACIFALDDYFLDEWSKNSAK